MRGTNKSWFAKGMRDAIPIALGYLAVSFTLGIAAKNAGFTPFQAFLVSFTNNASAGEFAGFTLIAAGGGYLEVAILILITNARYLLMSCALSQKLPPDTPMIQRLLLSYDVTDELFGISVAVPGKLNPYYSFGAYTVALPGWAFGTLFGTLMGSILPANIVSALSVGLYGMFLAIIIPPARKNKILAGVVLISREQALHLQNFQSSTHFLPEQERFCLRFSLPEVLQSCSQSMRRRTIQKALNLVY